MQLNISNNSSNNKNIFYKPNEINKTKILNKFALLRQNLSKLNSMLVAFSGGIDSSFLLKIAKKNIKEQVIAVTAISKIRPDEEIEFSKKIAEEIGVRQIIIKTNELQNDAFLQNTKNRCYICKKHLFLKLKNLAKDLKIDNIANGDNFDDLEKFRPGRRAAKEENILSPLSNAKLKKKEIRYLAKKTNLSNWNKPSFSCLATKVPYGTRIDI